jgi:hypothetical protein
MLLSSNPLRSPSSALLKLNAKQMDPDEDPEDNEEKREIEKKNLSKRQIEARLLIKS